MILDFILVGVLIVLALPFLFFGGWTLPPMVIISLTTAVQYFNTFLSIAPPLRIVFQYFVIGILMELILLVLKLLLGNRVPKLD